MSIRARLLLPAILAFGTAARLAGQTAEELPPSVATITSPIYPQVTCSGTNPAVVADVIQSAEDARDRLSPLLHLDEAWRFPVHIRVVMPDDPLAGKVPQSGVVVNASGNSMSVEAVVLSNDPDAHNFIEQQFVTEMVWEKFFANTHSFDTHTRLIAIPLWLTEGLRESLGDDAEHDREAIVHRAVAGGHAPTLEEVTGWTTLSDDRLLGMWQRAFCFYLVNSLTQKGAKLADFQDWLGALAGANAPTASYLFPTEAGWQQQLADSTRRGRDIVYTWNETAAELTAMQAIQIPSKHGADTRVCTIDSVESFPHDANLTQALQAKVNDLTALELRAHVGWRHVIELYRFGLSGLITDPKPDQAIALLHKARDQRVAETARHQQELDYVNWFEVTQNYGVGATHFQSYFSTAQQVDRAQADPAHPNPIRANILQVESQL